VRRSILFLALLACGAPGLAYAQAGEGDARGRARGLAEEAADLFDARQYEGALDHATQAEGLYHAPSNVLLIAEAQEGLGHLAAAADTYEKLVAEPLPPSAPHAFLSAQQTGKQRLIALLARVPSMLVTVKGGPTGEDVTIAVDGRTIASQSDIAERFDPGAHHVRVSAPGYSPFEQTVTLPARGGVNVIVAALVPVTDAASEPTAAEAEPPVLRRPQSGSRAPAYVAFGVGSAGLIVGAITGILSLSKVSDLRQSCPGNQCSSAEQGAINSAQSLGTTSTIGFVLGGVGVAAGTVLLFVHPSGGRAADSSSASITPWIGIGGVGVAGRF
jgi:hypothetical protein